MEEQQTSGQKHRRRRRRGGGNGAAGEGAEVISPEEAARLERERSEQLESIMEELGSKKKNKEAGSDGAGTSAKPEERAGEKPAKAAETQEGRAKGKNEGRPERKPEASASAKNGGKGDAPANGKDSRRQEKTSEPKAENKPAKTRVGVGEAFRPVTGSRAGLSLKDHFLSGLSLFIALALAILFYYLLTLMPQITKGISGFVKIIMPFIYGAVLAYLLVPVCNRIETFIRKVFRLKEGTGAYRAARPIGVVLAFGFALLMIGVLLGLVIPQVWTAVYDIMEIAPKNYDRLIKAVTKFFAKYPKIVEWISEYSDDVYNYGYNFLQTKILPNLAHYMGGISNGVLSAVTGVLNVIVGLIVAFYLLVSRGRFLDQAKMILYSSVKKPVADKICKEVAFTDDTFSGYINGKIIDSILVGVITVIGAALMGVPYPLLMGVVIGITNMIPIFGPFIGMVPCTIIILLISPIKSIYFIIFNIIMQQIDGNILTPWILGDSTGLSGFWVLFAITVFGGWWGFMGMIIGVPIFAVIYHLVRQVVQYGLYKKGLKVMVLDYMKEYYPDKGKKKSGVFSFLRRKKS